MTCQKIEVYEHQICNISLRIPGQNIGDWLCYGSAIRKGYQDCLHFNVEADSEKNLFKITIPSIDVKSAALKFELYEYQIFLKNINTHQEFLVISGEIEVKKRTCIHDAQESVSSTPIELEATISNNVLEVSVSIAGGLSAYEIAKLHGFSGTEEDWISELQGAADAANDARQSRESAQESLTSTLQAQDKCQEDAQKSENFKNEALGYSQSAALSANNAQIFAETSQAAAEVAEQKRDEAEAAASAANSSKIAAENYENNAKESKEAAISSQLAAAQAALDAQIAQSISEEQARIATEAAAAAQAPESIAAQAARPATMVLLKSELVRLLGDESMLHVDTDGQKIIVHTDRLADEQLAAVEDMLERFVPGFIETARYNHNMEISWRDINKYAECSTAQGMYMVDTEKNFFDEKLGYQVMDVCSDGSFPYANQLTSTAAGGSNYGTNVFSSAMTERGRFSGSFPALIHWYGGGVVEELILDAPELKSFAEVYSNRLTRIKCNSQILTSVVHLFWSSALRSVECVFPKLSTARFTTNAQLDKESVLRIIGSLPSYTSGTHELQLGIHTDLQNDEEVLAALALVDVEQTPVEEGGKGWTLAVKWNGTPTAQTSVTYGLRKPTIYARVCEFEGKRYLLTAHYVSDPENYEEFSSEEEAREYYGLLEEPLTNN